MSGASSVGAAARLPNLLIAGVSKAGTTSMFNYLGQHPDIGTSDVKELRYFTPLRYGEALAPIESYTRHFRGCERDRFALEATPGYFYGGRPLAAGIRETCPGAKVLVSLRSPADRCWSWFGFVRSRMRIPKDMTFEEYVDRCMELHAAGVDGLLEHQPFWGLGGGCYAQWLDAWVDEFADSFRVVFFDDLTRDPRGVLSSICTWLDLDTAPVDGFELEVENKTQQYRNQTLQRAAVAVNRRAERFFHEHQRLKRGLRRGYYSINRAQREPSMSPEMRRRLTDFYRPHNTVLADQLKRLDLRLPASWTDPAG